MSKHVNLTAQNSAVKPQSAPAKRIKGIPADTHPIAELSFVKRKWCGRSKFHAVTDWLDVPLEEYGAGNITGYRVTAELMAWASKYPDFRGHALQSTLGAAYAVLAQPHTFGKPSKRGAAVGIVNAMIGFLEFAAVNSKHGEYCERHIAESQKHQARRSEQDAIEKAQFVERMKAARAAKRAAKAVAA
jgi:hypothetical protein